MIAWGVGVPEIKKFIADMATKNSLEEADYSSIMAGNLYLNKPKECGNSAG